MPWDYAAGCVIARLTGAEVVLEPAVHGRGPCLSSPLATRSWLRVSHCFGRREPCLTARTAQCGLAGGPNRTWSRRRRCRDQGVGLSTSDSNKMVPVVLSRMMNRNG